MLLIFNRINLVSNLMKLNNATLFSISKIRTYSIESKSGLKSAKIIQCSRADFSTVQNLFQKQEKKPTESAFSSLVHKAQDSDVSTHFTGVKKGTINSLI